MNRIFVIGDIHGCYDELLELIDKIAFDEHDLLISVGDIVDRGNKSLEVYHFFRDLPNAKILMGNHERKHLNGVLSYAQEIVKLQFKNEYPEFIEWLKNKRYYFEFDDLIVVHAALEYDKKLEDQNDSVLSGSTAGEKYMQSKLKPNTFWNDFYFGEKTIVYGHTVIGNYPKIYNNTIGIDTGACHGGLLTAVEFPGQIIHQVHSKNDYWREEQQKWQLPILKEKKWSLLEFKKFEKLKNKLSYVEDAEVKKYLNEL
ncbi:metallophosphoesterase [Pedobacter vanadiisoli]|uniref:Metallophosphoesterase n=1 Tax=Pedobacter vanadiisoli TaxID=1761975 RepID=A0ABW5MF06_9SPHI